MKTIAQISAELQGYDPQALTCPDVNLFLSKLVAPVTGTENVHLFDALGRVLAQDIISPDQCAATRQLGHGWLCI